MSANSINSIALFKPATLSAELANIGTIMASEANIADKTNDPIYKANLEDIQRRAKTGHLIRAGKVLGSIEGIVSNT
jgi:hypothetical protein